MKEKNKRLKEIKSHREERKEKYDKAFYQAKFDLNSDMAYSMLLIVSLMSVFYYATDYMAFGHFELMPLIARLSIIPAFLIFSYFFRKYNDYVIRSIACFGLENYVMWTMIWALAYRSERVHAGEGFMIMNIIILGISLSAPVKYALISHILFIVNVVASHYLFNHYESFSLILIIAIPCIIGIYTCERVVENQAMRQYMTSRQLEDLSHEDYISKAYSRNILSVICENHGERLKLDGWKTAGVATIEIDDFKKILSRNGRSTVDQLLAETAKYIKGSVDEKDYVIRWATNQFLVISRDLNCSKMYEIMEKLRVNIDASKQFPVHITITAGISAYENGTFSKAVERSEDALERAVNAGRNRVSVETSH